jgi:hypothetical protein
MKALRRLYPITIGLYNTDEFIKRVSRADVFLHGFFTAVERDLIGTRTYVTIISIGHFAGTIYYAAHNANLQAFKVAGTAADHLCGDHQIEQGTPAAWAADIFCFGNTRTGGLQNTKSG